MRLCAFVCVCACMRTCVCVYVFFFLLSRKHPHSNSRAEYSPYNLVDLCFYIYVYLRADFSKFPLGARYALSSVLPFKLAILVIFAQWIVVDSLFTIMYNFSYRLTNQTAETDIRMKLNVS